jgi:hypothetical protein
MRLPSLTRYAARTRRRVRALRRRAGSVESGRAVVEFVFLGVLLLVPLVYLVATLGRLQAAAYSATTAAREAGRAFTTADTEAATQPRAHAAAALAFEDFGFAEGTSVHLVCDGAPCLRPDARVSVTVTIRVRLPLVPDLVASAIPTEIPVSATHVATVDRFGGR